MLSIKVPNLIYSIAAMRVRAPRNQGDTTRFRRPNKLLTATVPLGNSGMPTPSQNLTAVDIDCKVQTYGTSVVLNEQVTLFNNDPVLNWATNLLGVSLRETEDELVSSMLASSASAINCVAGTNGDVPTNITRSDISNVIKVLMNNDAYTIMDKVTGENKFGTAPVRNAYFVMSSTNLTSDLDGVTGFQNVSQYPNQQSVMRSEYGCVSGARFLVSSKGSFTASASSTGATVYNNIFVGMDSYGILNQDGYSSQFIYRPAIFSDPLAQNASLGYKTGMGQRILNDQWLSNLRCTITA